MEVENKKEIIFRMILMRLSTAMYTVLRNTVILPVKSCYVLRSVCGT
jgi:hypothetical protein